MKKTISFIISVLTILSILVVGNAYATETEETGTHSISEIIEEINKEGTPYYMGTFDFNEDGSVDSFDMVALRKKLTDGESDITVATAVKLERWLLGKDCSLEIVEYHCDGENPSIFKKEHVKNLMSNDFRFAGCSESRWNRYYGDSITGICLHFIGVDEYCLQHISIYNFCSSKEEFDELVAEENGFAVGIKNNSYALALANGFDENEGSTVLDDKMGPETVK